jgi:endonuclease/exonuclease/phosphatase family metal-dependent hydrolase
MVQYTGLRNPKDFGVADRKRTIDRLLALRQALATQVAANNKEETFLLASWNIRDFGGHRLNPSPRGPEPLLYIAEIISAFDLVAIQEVNEDMTAFRSLMRLLGPNWDHIMTDQTGNMERLAFVFDRRKIRFRNIAAKVVLPGKKGKPAEQFNRSPFIVAFQAGWFQFNICTVHIYYGSASDTRERVREIADIARFFADRQKKDGETYILLGDFNILDPQDTTMKALTDGGFMVPKELQQKTALAGKHYYDQIALRAREGIVEIAKAGCFHWQDVVFRDNETDYKSYKLNMPVRTKGGKPAQTDMAAYRRWRTWQISDHLPLWAEIKMDFTERYLGSLNTDRPLAHFGTNGKTSGKANGSKANGGNGKAPVANKRAAKKKR